MTDNTLMIPEFCFPSEWDHTNELINDEELSAVSTEVSQVLEQWQQPDLDVMMQVDDQLNPANFSDTEIFHDPCFSPTCPVEELESAMDIDQAFDNFSLAHFDAEQEEQQADTKASSTSSVDFEDRYKEMLLKLSESMKRSQQTRMSLKMKTPKTKNYERRKSVSGVLSSIEKSTQQLQQLIKIQPNS